MRADVPSLLCARLTSALLLTGCVGEPQPTTIDAPAEPLFVALLSLTDGVPTRASGLVRWNPGEGLPLFADPALEHVIIGYTGADLAALDPLDEALVREVPLRMASGCEPPLPAPSWKARWAMGAAAPAPAEAELVVPKLTASWLLDRCERVDGSRWMVETSCNDFGVFPLVVPSDLPCTENLNITTYQLPTLSGRLWYDGRTCAEPAELTPRCVPDPVQPGVVDCGGDEPCQLVVRLNDHSSPPFTSRSIDLLPGVEPYRDRYYEETREYRASRTVFGWVRDLVVLEDRVWVAALERPVEYCPNPTEGYVPGRLIRVDRDTMRPVVTATAPSCVGHMAPDDRGGFLLIYAEDDSNWIARYDADGRQLEKRLVGTGPEDPVSNLQTFQVLGFERLRSGEFAVLITDIFHTENNPDSQLLVLDPSTLQVRRRLSSLGVGLGHFIVELDDNRVAVAFEGTNAVQYVDLSGPSLEMRVPFEHDPGIGTHGLGVVDAELYYAAYTIVLSFNTATGAERWREPVSARPMVVLRAVPWPANPDLVAVFGISPRQYFPLVTLLTFLDRKSGHFLPGVYEIGGEGVPHQVEPDGADGYYVLQPWGAQLTHVTPKNP